MWNFPIIAFFLYVFSTAVALHLSCVVEALFGRVRGAGKGDRGSRRGYWDFLSPTFVMRASLVVLIAGPGPQLAPLLYPFPSRGTPRDRLLSS